jgi:hypothetical protein
LDFDQVRTGLLGSLDHLHQTLAAEADGDGLQVVFWLGRLPLGRRLVRDGELVVGPVLVELGAAKLQGAGEVVLAKLVPLGNVTEAGEEIAPQHQPLVRILLGGELIEVVLGEIGGGLRATARIGRRTTFVTRVEGIGGAYSGINNDNSRGTLPSTYEDLRVIFSLWWEW